MGLEIQNSHAGQSQPEGGLGLTIRRRDGRVQEPRRLLGVPYLKSVKPGAALMQSAPSLDAKTSANMLRMALREGLPLISQPKAVRSFKFQNLPHLWRGMRTLLIAQQFGIPTFFGDLSLKVIRADGRVMDLGLVSLRVVTDTGVARIVDALDNSVADADFNFHGLGTGSNAEAAGDTALQTELTTEYTGNVRATGAESQPAANQMRNIGTNTLDETPGAALREHGLFSSSSGGTLLDRSVYAAITLVSGDALQSTYTLTFTSGG